MFNRTSLLIANATVLALVIAAGFANAWSTVNRTMYLTFSGPVALPGVTLGTGTYVFEVADPNVNPDVVCVRSRDRSRMLFLGLTQRVKRPEGLPASHHVSFGEGAPGMPPPITAWYPQDQSFSHQFIYPAKAR